MIADKFTMLTTLPQAHLGRFCCAEVNVDPDARLTVAQAAEYLGLTKANINKWYVDGHLTNVTTNDKGHRLYLMSELVEAEHNTRHHPNSRRKSQLAAA